MAEYIDRQAAKRALRDYFDDPVAWENVGRLVAEICDEVIDDIPAIDICGRPKGKWIEDMTDMFGFVRCSECGRLEEYPQFFCPHCGADLREDKDVSKNV